MLYFLKGFRYFLIILIILMAILIVGSEFIKATFPMFADLNKDLDLVKEFRLYNLESYIKSPFTLITDVLDSIVDSTMSSMGIY